MFYYISFYQKYVRFCIAMFFIGIIMKSYCTLNLPVDTKNDLEEMRESESKLVHKASLGDKQSFAILINKYREKLYRVIYWMVKHEEDTLDLLQETFIHSYQSLPKLKEPGTFSSWITKIAVNLSINHIKKKRRIYEYQIILKNEKKIKEILSPETILEQKEINDYISYLISQLPPKQKIVLILCDIEEFSYKEAAKILGCNIGTIMSRLFYARDFIRKKMEAKSDI